jgi:hypothetical protein
VGRQETVINGYVFAGIREKGAQKHKKRRADGSAPIGGKVLKK